MTDLQLQQLRRLFEVMEQLRAPGGCPWDRAQTHLSLLSYLLEETYELIEAAGEGQPGHLAEELGDLLVQVAMHCAIADEEHAFDVGEVAKGATEKMVRRHPHVFAGSQIEGVEQLLRNWERLKREEKPERSSVLQGIPRSLPALALASAVQRREPGNGEVGDPGLRAEAEVRSQLEELTAKAPEMGAEDAVGELLFAAVALSRSKGVDAEAALRRTVQLRHGEVETRAPADRPGRSQD